MVDDPKSNRGAKQYVDPTTLSHHRLSDGRNQCCRPEIRRRSNYDASQFGQSFRRLGHLLYAVHSDFTALRHHQLHVWTGARHQHFFKWGVDRVLYKHAYLIGA